MKNENDAKLVVDVVVCHDGLDREKGKNSFGFKSVTNENGTEMNESEGSEGRTNVHKLRQKSFQQNV